MQFKLEKLEKNFVLLEVTTEVNEVEEALSEGYKKVVNKVNLPGFRKGHIPRHILEAQFGKEVLYEDAMEILVSKAYFEGLKKYDLSPIDQPKLDVTEPFEAGKNFNFKVTIEVLPEVKLGQYKGLEIEKKSAIVGEKEINERLEALQKRHAELVLSDKKVLENGDFAVIDFEGFVDDKPFSGGAAQSYTLEIGSGNFIPGFEEQLIGMEVNSEREVNVVFPEDYQSEDLAGKDAVFKVALKEIKVKEVPEIDDEFAKSVGNFENLEQLKDDLKIKITQMAEKDVDTSFTQDAVNKAVENAEVDVPEILVKKEMEDLMHRFEHNLSYQGITLDRYLTYVNKSQEDIMEGFRPEAQKRVQTDLVLNKIAVEEKLEVPDDELNAKIKELATMYEQKDPVKLRRDLEKRGRLDDLKQAILLEKATDFIKENSIQKVTE